MENQNQDQVQNQVATPQTGEPREIKLSELSAYVAEGKKQEDLMEIYGLNAAQVRKLMKSANLEFRRFRRPAFVLVRDIPSSSTNVADPSPSLTEANVQEIPNTPRVEELPQENPALTPTPMSGEKDNSPEAQADVEEDWI